MSHDLLYQILNVIGTAEDHVYEIFAWLAITVIVYAVFNYRGKN